MFNKAISIGFRPIAVGALTYAYSYTGSQSSISWCEPVLQQKANGSSRSTGSMSGFGEKIEEKDVFGQNKRMGWWGRTYGWIANTDKYHFEKYYSAVGGGHEGGDNTRDNTRDNANTAANIATNTAAIPSMENLFTYPSLSRGIKRRIKDEQKLRSLSARANAALLKNDRVLMSKLANSMSSVAYGPGVTPQVRQESLERHGCVEWTDEIMDAIRRVGVGKGVVEIGAGNGQWSRKLYDLGVDILAFDDMSSVPLNRNLYHGGTKPNRDHFFHDVKRGDMRVFRKDNVGMVGVGRVLLIVYPDRGEWCKETVEIWRRQSVLNRVMVYVGEGRGGANASDSFFDYIEKGGWRVLKVFDIKVKGGKGYEKAFFLERVEEEKKGCCKECKGCKCE